MSLWRTQQFIYLHYLTKGGIMGKQWKQYSSVLGTLMNGGSEPITDERQAHREKLAANRQLAYQAMRDGLKVFMTKETCEGFERILKTKPTTSLMRSLLADIAKGTLVIAPATNNKPLLTGVIRTKPVAIPMVPSVDQLTGGLPLTLKQAAKVLNVKPQQLYMRCITGRVHFQRERSRYYIPAAEVQRLHIIGV